MVEPISLSLGAIVAGLIAKASERASEEAVDAGDGALRRLVSAVRERFAHRGDEVVGQALASVAEVPDSPSRVRGLAELVDQRADTDAKLRRELEELIAQT